MNNIIGFALWNDAARASKDLPHFQDWDDEERDGYEDFEDSNEYDVEDVD